MSNKNKLQKGEGKINSFDREWGRATQRMKMVDHDAQLEKEQDFWKYFYTSANIVEK